MSGEGGASTMRLAFSTLGCPDWPIERVAEAAREYGYDGVELRIFEGERLPPRLPDDQRRRLRTALRGLPVACVDTSLQMANLAPGWEDDLRGHVEQAADLGAPFVRVFGGSPPAGISDLVHHLQRPLLEAGTIATAAGVRVALETHDDLSAARVLGPVLDAVPAEAAVTALWDLHHPYRMGESPEEVWRVLGKHIGLVHVKDARRDVAQRTGWQLVLLGDGEVPVHESLDLLQARGYGGWVSVEWEKAWHPEIEPPEIALPQHAEVLRRWLR